MYATSTYTKQVICIGGHCKEITRAQYQPLDQYHAPIQSVKERDYTLNQKTLSVSPMYHDERYMLQNNKGKLKY